MWSFADDQNNDRRWKTCGCCHVRAATAILGMWHMILHVIALGVLAVVLLHPEKLERSPLVGPSTIKTTSYKDGQYHTAVTEYLHVQKYTVEDLNVGLLVTFVTFCITIMLLYGTVRGRPSYLLPFFCLQMFDLFMTGLAVIGYLGYVPDVRRVIVENPNVPFRDWLLSLDSQWLAIVILMFFMVALVMKAYFLWIVWSCYKYLIWRQTSLRMPELNRDDPMVAVGVSVLDSQYVKLPLGLKYPEGDLDSVPLTAVQDPPPPYTAVDAEEQQQKQPTQA